MSLKYKGHNSTWWDQQEGRLRKYIAANPVTRDTTFDEIRQGLDATWAGCGRIPKYALAQLCRLWRLEISGLPIDKAEQPSILLASAPSNPTHNQDLVLVGGLPSDGADVPTASTLLKVRQS